MFSFFCVFFFFHLIGRSNNFIFFHPLELSQTRTPTDILSLRLFSKTQIMFQCGNKGNSFSYLNNKVGSIWLFVIIIYLLSAFQTLDTQVVYNHVVIDLLLFRIIISSKSQFLFFFFFLFCFCFFFYIFLLVLYSSTTITYFFILRVRHKTKMHGGMQQTDR